MTFKPDPVEKRPFLSLRPQRFGGLFASLALALVLALTLSSAAAAVASKTPPTPQNFRVTAKTAYTVTVAWNAAPASAGDFNYHLSGASGVTAVVLPAHATSHTFTGLYPGNEYWFFLYARNSAGRTSGQVSTGTRTLSDTTPPSTAPVVTATETGSTYVKLAWTPAQDDGPYQFYEVWLNGSLNSNTGKNITSTTLQSLQPATTYAVSVRAYDYGGNRSPFSDPVTVTTLPRNPNDTTPPTVPANLQATGTGDGSTETHLRWTQSTDNFDAQANLRYDIFVNGVWQDVVFGSGGPRIIYAEFGENLIEVTATDTAGNSSAPARVRVVF